MGAPMSDSNWQFAVRGEKADTLELDIYDTIGDSFFGGVSAKDVRATLREARNAKTIRLRVNSRGGDVWDGFAIYSLLKEHPARVEADVDALAASMASVVVMAADEIRIAQGAMIMVHNPWSVGVGDADDMRSMAELLDKVRGQIADAYTARTGQSRDDVLSMMDAETWMTADEALEKRFADKVKPNKSAKTRAFASLDLRGFKSVPSFFAMAVDSAREQSEARQQSETPKDASAVGGGQEIEEMDIKALKAQHPQLVDDLLAEGRTQGAAAEHERVCSHLTMGKQAGPKGMDIAVMAIEGKEPFGTLAGAKYMAVAMNHRDVSARQAESDAVGAVVDGANPTAVAKDLGDEIVALMDAKSGKKKING